MLSQIVIEADAHGDSQTMLRLSIDKHLVAENLTAAQARFLIEEILDRIPFAEVGERVRRWSDSAQADASASRGARSLLGPCARPPSHSHAARAKRISVLSARPQVSEASGAQRLISEGAKVFLPARSAENRPRLAFRGGARAS
jgi:hypothetical protein